MVRRDAGDVRGRAVDAPDPDRPAEERSRVRRRRLPRPVPHLRGRHGVSAPDAQTLVVTTEYPNTQILTSYLPILPKHIWEKRDINTDPNNVPVVGTGPYQAVEWKTGEYVRFVRNPNYQGPTPASYQEETFIQFFKDAAAMIEALKSGDIDYARNVTADQFDSLKGQPDIAVAESAVAAEANAFTHMVFNTHEPFEGGGASTSAVRDPAFRDALGFAIDKPALVDKVLGGHGLVGSTIIPPAMARRPVAPRASERARLRPRRRQPEARRRGLQARRQRQAARPRGEADQPEDGRAIVVDLVYPERRIPQRVVEGARHRRDDPVARC